MLETIIAVIVGISIILLIGTIIHNKFQLAIIKIEKAEDDIAFYLEKKRELLSRTRPIITKELKLETFLAELDDNFKEINNFEQNDILKKSYNEFLKIIDDNDKLLKSEALSTIISQLNENEEDFVGAIRFYNDTVVNYNKLIASFPSNIIGFFMRLKRKEFYNNEKKEMFEILNEK